MELKLYIYDLKTEFIGVPSHQIDFSHFTSESQLAILAVGKANFYNSHDDLSEPGREILAPVYNERDFDVNFHHNPKNVPFVVMNVKEDNLETMAAGAHLMAVEVVRKNGTTARFHVTLHHNHKQNSRVSCEVSATKRDDRTCKSVTGSFVDWKSPREE